MNTSSKPAGQVTPPINAFVNIWWKIGLLSFGGPASQIALMHKEVVEKQKWLTEQQFLNALSFCMLLPGPEAMQLATYSGWHLRGVFGGLSAGLLFVIPGACIITILALVYHIYGDVPLVTALFFGIKAAVLVIVLEALLRVAKKALKRRIHWVIAAIAFVGIFFLSIPYPFIILIAGIYGYCTGISSGQLSSTALPQVSIKSSLSTTFTWLALWLLPLFALAYFNAPTILVEIGKFFSTLAVVTFGGAYAVLAYMAQDVVVQFGWLNAGEMVDALGLAETTPGPLILVTQFVGFLAGAQEGGIWLGFWAGIVALWVTFTPCFLWIFLCAPYIEWVSSRPKLTGALEAITSAVVGVILNLSIWFALHVLFAKVSLEKYGPLTLWVPDFYSLELGAVFVFLVSAVLAFFLHWGIVRILFVAAISGALFYFYF